MVERGQLLERMTTIEGPQGRLEGLWQGGGIKGAADDEHERPVVFCGPHPRLGGNMDSPVSAELVWALGRRRHPTLRFNYAGVGASQGENTLPWLPPPSPLSRAALQPLVDDASAAVAHVKASVGGPVVVVGVSVGALVAAVAAVEFDDVAEAVFVAPALDVAAFDLAAVEAAGVPFRVYAGADDAFCPVDRLQKIAPHAVVIPGANHTFSRGLPALAAAVAAQLSGGRATPTSW